MPIMMFVQGLQLFSLDERILFAPTDLDVDLTPSAVKMALRKEAFTLALNMSLHLGEEALIREVLHAVPIASIDLVVKSIDIRIIKQLLKFLACELVRFNSMMITIACNKYYQFESFYLRCITIIHSL